ncbi:cysteine hydrolase family protein [Streptomyces gilvifuscus]|uniref:Cysteine hydrolase family protein n=1 Tax=Streptomyces gilvifuscus TaxID=1550617 RepID=A0ABT5G3X1_9ACTN|nr:cysteine hydrolase family protein [Streptomyces gilvifuscus]MDC2959498.1 cysteine hydrolase family protein [Streptomyces gilvifuscus]
MQRCRVQHSGIRCEGSPAEAARVLSRAREAGIPVIHVRHDAGAGSPYDLEADVGQISAEVAPAAGEPVITKDHPSSFFGTDLETRLQRTRRQDLVLVGFMTHMCVNSTARDAFNLGYRPTIVAAATATREVAGADGKPVTATELQEASLAGMADLFAVVVGKAEEIPD